MARLRTGFIGCGRIVGKHVGAVRELADDLELVAVCDLVPERAAHVAKQTGARPYTDYNEMIERERLDLVHILTWSGNHAAIAIACAGRVPNLLIEKPMALRLIDADRLIETCDHTGTRLFVVKQNRYNPPVVALRRALDQGRFGRLIMGTVRVRWARTPEYYRQDAWRGTWALDGGVLANQASHHIDLLAWVFGPVETVFAKTDTFLAPIEAEDTGVVLLKFKSGALGIVEATTCTRPRDLEGSISVLGSLGTVEIGGFAVNETRVWQFTDPLPEDELVFDASTNPPDVYGFGHVALLRDVVAAIRENRRFMIDGLEGRRSVELLNAIYESVERGSEVTVTFSPSFCRLGEPVGGGS
jgi:UDP-N-acetyl-2-amino-2-deoxyglucuronate dehydrogenase